MSSIFIIRIILVTILFVILLTIYKINRIVLLDKRISRYSLKRLSTEDISFSDKFLIKYKKNINKFYKNKYLKKLSLKYDKYLYGMDDSNAVIFIINKLVIACLFVLLIIISNTIKGNVISFVTFLFCFIILL